MAETRLKIDAEAEVSTTELAAILGVTARRCSRWRRTARLFPSGAATSSSATLFSDISISFPSRRSAKPSRSWKQQNGSLKHSSSYPKPSLQKMEVEELKGKLHRSEDVEGFTEDLIYTIRDALLSLPGRLSVDVTAAQSPRRSC